MNKLIIWYDQYGLIIIAIIILAFFLFSCDKATSQSSQADEPTVKEEHATIVDKLVVDQFARKLAVTNILYNFCVKDDDIDTNCMKRGAECINKIDTNNKDAVAMVWKCGKEAQVKP